MVPAYSHEIPRVSWYSGYCLLSSSFVYRAFTFSGRLSQNLSTGLLSLSAVLTPWCTHQGLGSSGFARRYSRNHFCFLFLRLLRCFSSPGCPRRAIFFPLRRPGLPRAGSPIRTPADRRACAPPRSFSQLVASFFGPQCQGIRPAPSFCLSSAAATG